MYVGRFKTLLVSLYKWFYYNLWRELCVFLTFYKSITDGRSDGRNEGQTERWTDTASYRDARTHLKTEMSASVH